MIGLGTLKHASSSGSPRPRAPCPRSRGPSITVPSRRAVAVTARHPAPRRPRPGRLRPGRRVAAPGPRPGHSRGSWAWPPWPPASPRRHVAPPTGTPPSTRPPSPTSTSTHGRPQPPGYWLYVAAGPAGPRLRTRAPSSHWCWCRPLPRPGRGSGRGGRSRSRRALGRPGRRRGGGHVAFRLVQRIDRGHLLVRSGRSHPLLIILAWRARPHSWHGAGALAALGLVAGFRQSDVQCCSPSSPCWPSSVRCGGSARRSVAVRRSGRRRSPPGSCRWRWPSPGGSQALGSRPPASRPGGRPGHLGPRPRRRWSVNLGTFAAYTTVALAPLAALALVGRVVGLGRARCASSDAVRSTAATPTPARSPTADPGPVGSPTTGAPAHRRRRPAPTGPGPGTSRAPSSWPGGHRAPDGRGRPGAVRQGRLPAGLPPRSGHRPAAGARAALHPHRIGPGVHRSAARRVSWSGAWWPPSPCAAIAVLGADRFLDRDRRPPGAGTIRAARPVADPGPLPGAVPRHPRRHPFGRRHRRGAGPARPPVDPAATSWSSTRSTGGRRSTGTPAGSCPPTGSRSCHPGSAVYNEQGGSLYYTTVRRSRWPRGLRSTSSPRPTCPDWPALAGTGKVAGCVHAPRIGDYLVWRIAPGCVDPRASTWSSSPGPARSGPGIAS